MGNDTAPALRIYRLHGLERRHGIGEPAAERLLQEEEHQRNNDDDQTHRGGKTVVRADLAHKLRIQHDREGLIPLADDHGRAEVGKHAHEYEQRAREQRRHHQREDDLRYALEGVAA